MEILFSCRFSRSPGDFGHHKSRHKPDKNGERHKNDFGHGHLPEVDAQCNVIHVLEQENHEENANGQAGYDFGVFHVFSLPVLQKCLLAIVLLFGD